MKYLVGIKRDCVMSLTHVVGEFYLRKYYWNIQILVNVWKDGTF